MSAVILSDSYDVLRDTIHVGNLHVAGLAIWLLSLSDLSHFGGKELSVPNHLNDKII